ncbi:MAG: PEGA domain-containing protein, partial [Candidatus Angelobacter sp.]
HSSGGARPQTAEIIKTFGEKCPDVMVNNIQAKANYVVVLDHEGGKGYLRHRNKVAVFDAQSGDSIISKSTLSLGGSVDEACRGIAQHWAGHKPSMSTSVESVPATKPDAVVAVALDSKQLGARLNVASTPVGADIEIDGNFMGNTPSSLLLQPGDHLVAVKKAGYKAWERKMKVAGGDVNIRADLEKEIEAAK